MKLLHSTSITVNTYEMLSNSHILTHKDNNLKGFASYTRPNYSIQRKEHTNSGERWCPSINDKIVLDSEVFGEQMI